MQQLYYDAKNLLSCYNFFKMGQLITFADPEGAGVLAPTSWKNLKALWFLSNTGPDPLENHEDTITSRPSKRFGGTGEKGIISGEQGYKYQNLRGTGQQRQYWGRGKFKKQIFDFWGAGEQANLFQGNKGTGTSLRGHHHQPANETLF